MSIALHDLNTVVESIPTMFAMTVTATGAFIYRSIVVRDSDPVMQRANEEVEARGLELRRVERVLDPDMMFGEALAMTYICQRVT